jgi:hypothetical protein
LAGVAAGARRANETMIIRGRIRAGRIPIRFPARWCSGEF